jgi:nitrogen fixation NifU-like protein
MMTAAVKGKSREQAQALTQEFLAMATGKLDLSQPNQIGRLAVFAGVRDLPTRVKCAILPWHTLQAAFHSQGTASTETSPDS